MKTISLLVALTLAGAVLTMACGDNDDGGMSGGGDSAGVSTDSSFGADGAEAAAPQEAGDDALEEQEAGRAPADEESAPSAAGLGSFDRKIIESATIDLEVDDVIRSFSTVSRIASEAGGFVASSNVYSEDDERYATLTVRVPAEEYTETLERLRGLGEVASEGSNASDVTEEFTDLESRLRNLQAVEAQYVQLLARQRTSTTSWSSRTDSTSPAPR